MNYRWIVTICAAALLAASGCKKEQTKPDEEMTEQTEDAEATTDEANDGDAVDADDATKEPGDDIPPPANVSGVPPDAEASDSGLAWIVLEEGDGGAKPTTDSTITVHYTGWKTSGEMFDSSVVRGEPIEFPLSKLIMGWQEGIPMMTKGEKRRFWVPGELAYDKSEREGVPKGMLVFDIELLDFDMQPTPDVEEKE